jgi:hypothetical protein
LTGDQPVGRPLPTHRTRQTQNKRAHTHPCIEWDSNPRSHGVRAGEDGSCLRPRRHCGRHLRNYVRVKQSQILYNRQVCALVSGKNGPASLNISCKIRTSVHMRCQYVLYMRLTNEDRSAMFWDVAPCSLLEVCRRFGGKYYIHFQAQTINRVSQHRASCFA